MANKKTLPAPIDVDNKILQKITECKNVDDTAITVTETKLENYLLKHKKALEVGSDWKTPLGLGTAIILVFLTTEFNKDFLGVKRYVWETGFWILLIVSAAWFVRSCVSKYQNRNEDIKSLIHKIKGKES